MRRFAMETIAVIGKSVSSHCSKAVAHHLRPLPGGWPLGCCFFLSFAWLDWLILVDWFSKKSLISNNSRQTRTGCLVDFLSGDFLIDWKFVVLFQI